MAENDGSGASNQLSNTLSSLIPTLPNNHPISVKLGDNNYLIWRQQVLATIEGYGLESFLIGDHPPKTVEAGQAGQMQANPEFLACIDKTSDYRLGSKHP